MQMVDNARVVVYLMTGFLESGKTSFLRYTLGQEYFAIDGRTLLILCEEGEEEYDEAALERSNTVLLTVDDPEDLTTEWLSRLDRTYHPERVIIECNGMYPVSRIESMDAPPGWGLVQKLVTVDALEEVDGIVNPVSAIFGEGKLSGSIAFSGGNDGTMDAVNAGVYIGVDNGPGKRTGIQSFLENTVASIIAIPGVTIPEVIVSLVAHCENEKNRFAIIDIPQELVKTGDIIEYRNMIDSTYAAMYHPWIQVFDPVTKKPGFIPPSGAVAGVYSRTDVARGVHKAPANETVSCTGLSVNYNTGEQDILNPAGVNLIRALPGQGIRVWGARTASSNSSFKYVNVRRLFIYVEQSIKNATNWVVFEPNNSSLWARVQMTISAFLENLFRAGMLSGETPAEAFFVDIGPTTMSQDDILNGRLICEIGIAPSRPAEFVIFRVTQFTSEAGGSAE